MNTRLLLPALLLFAACSPSFALDPVPPWRGPDTKPASMRAYGVREARATDATHVRVVIGTCCTGASGETESWRIVSEDDPAYAHALFVRPKAVKAVSKGPKPEFSLPDEPGLPSAADYRVLRRTEVELELPSPLRDGCRYSVVAYGKDGTMVTAANTAAAFDYPGTSETGAYDTAFAARAVGLRQIRSVGNGLLAAEFGAAFAPARGMRTEAFAVTVNGAPAPVLALGRRSKLDFYQPEGYPFKGYQMHEVFLDIGRPLAEGDKVEVTLDPAAIAAGAANSADFVFSTRESFSDALQANQVGYLPDTLKVAYLGRWLGSFPEVFPAAQKEAGATLSTADVFGASDEAAPDAEGALGALSGAASGLPAEALRFAEPPAFELRDEATHKVAFRGTAKLTVRASDVDLKRNHSGSNVYELDFTDFRTPGRYYLAVAGVGRSLPFAIGPDAYRHAFDIAAYGVFAQRCGIELAPPYSEWRRIACHTNGIAPVTDQRWESHEWPDPKHVETRANPEGASPALRAAWGRPSLLAHLSFDDEAGRSVATGAATLAPRGGGSYVEDGGITGSGRTYRTGSGDDNGFEGEVTPAEDGSLSVAFWFRRANRNNDWNGTLASIGANRGKGARFQASWGSVQGLGRNNDGEWHAVAFVLDGTAKTTTVYLDGKPVHTRDYAPDPVRAFQFAQLSGNAPEDTDFDELRLYGEALPAEAVAALAERVSDRVPVDKLRASGGHHDAGDYNPRSHIDVAQTLLWAYDLAPRKFYDGQLNIPEKNNGIPDVVDEALWALKVWHGLYDPATGAVRDGTESDGDPNFIQTAELDPKGDFAWAANSRGSLLYAGTVAQAARILRPFDAEKADALLGRARKAYAWGRENKPAVKNAEQFSTFYVCPLAYASVELYRATGEKTYHEDFLANIPWRADPKADLIVWRKWDLTWAAYAYALVPDADADPDVKAAVVDAIRREAEMYVRGSAQMGYKFIRHPFAPINWGTGAYESYSLPIATMGALTGESRWRDWLVRTCDNTLGANPLCLSYITGLGPRRVHMPLHNSRYSPLGESAPGMQVEGPVVAGDNGKRNVNNTFHPRFSDSHAILHSFVDVAFAIGMDEGVVNNQVKTMAIFGLLLPDHE